MVSCWFCSIVTISFPKLWGLTQNLCVTSNVTYSWTYQVISFKLQNLLCYNVPCSNLLIWFSTVLISQLSPSRLTLVINQKSTWTHWGCLLQNPTLVWLMKKLRNAPRRWSVKSGTTRLPLKFRICIFASVELHGVAWTTPGLSSVTDFYSP